MERKRNRTKSGSNQNGSILLEAVFAVGIFAIYLLAVLDGSRSAAESAQVTFLNACSSQNARMGMEKIAACPFDKIVATNWPPEVCALQIPEHFDSVLHFSTNFYLISSVDKDKLIIIRNIFEHQNRLLTNELYFRAIDAF